MAWVAEAVSGVVAPSELTKVSRHLATCSACRDAVLMLCGMDEAVSGPAVPTAPPLHIRKIEPQHRIFAVKALAVAACVLLMAGIGFVGFFQPYFEDLPGEEMQIKGHDDGFFVGVSRGPHRFSAEPFDKLEKHDSLGMFYTAKEAGYLMVVNMDNTRSVSLLYPVGENQSGAIGPGVEVSLSDGAEVQAGSGCEWIIAFFSDAPIPVSDVFRVVKEVTVLNKTCDLHVSMPEARTIRVLPFQR
jgi:hypothetical protein